MEDKRRPIVGIQAIVTERRGSRILMGKRRGIYGDGQWALPGGHLEFGESFEGATVRELREETNIHAEQLVVWKSLNTAYGDTHYVQIGVQVGNYRGDVENLEPNKCSELRWVSLDDALPKPLFAPSKPFLGWLRESHHAASARLAKPTLPALPSLPPLPTLTIFLHSIEPELRRDRYISYMALGDPPEIVMRLGRRNERVDRQIRSYRTRSVEEAFELVKRDISLRLKHGYCLYDVHGSYSVEAIRSLFPEGAIAFRSVAESELVADEEIRRNLEYQLAQLPLF